MTLSIDRMSVHLPSALEPRADRIVRLVVEELAGFAAGVDRTVTTLVVPPVQVDPRQPDRLVAAVVAAAIVDELGSLP
jgi:hypothetical protein